MTPAQCEKWFEENLTVIRDVASKGFILAGRGSVTALFTTKPPAGVQVTFVAADKLKLDVPGIQNDFLAKIADSVASYDPETEAVVLVMVDGKVYTLANIKFTG